MKPFPAAVTSVSIVGALILCGLEAYANPLILVLLPIGAATTGGFLLLTSKERESVQLQLQEAEKLRAAEKIEKALAGAKESGVELCLDCRALPRESRVSEYWHISCCRFRAHAKKRVESRREWNAYCRGELE